MGIVLRVHDPELNRTLALKRMKSPRRGDAVAEETPESARRIARFLDEAQVTGQLDHPGIIPVHELGLDPEGQPYFTMKLVRGKTLQEVLPLAREGSEGWSTTRVVGVLLRICEAMSYAHAHGVVHRDLKPSNVMLGRFGEVFVMDWGLARVFGVSDGAHSTELIDWRHGGSPGSSPLITEEGEVFGTPAYMSPEQALGDSDAVGPQTDVYAVGAILYEVLCGTAPFTSKSSPVDNRQVLARLRSGPPTSIEEVARSAPPELVAICRRAMERVQESRYDSMGHLADDLRAYLELRVVRAYRTGPLVELRKWVARNRSAAGLVAALMIVLLGAGIVFGGFQRSRARDQELRADSLEATQLAADAERLWPIHPDALPSMENWMARADGLITRSGDRTHELHALRNDLLRTGRAKTVPIPTDPRLTAEADAAHARAVSWSAYLEEKRATPPRNDATPVEIEQVRSAFEVLPAEIEYWEARAKHLRRDSPVQEALQCVDRFDQSRADALTRLVNGLEVLEQRVRPVIVERAESSRVARQAAESPAWTEAIAQIDDPSICGAYGGKVRLRPQVGLVPLGCDPRSGLHEFWHVLTGERPDKGEDGNWKIGPETGVILVLVPGGPALAGAQATDPLAARYDPDARKTEAPRRVELDPYFLSKYELSQGQWRRITGRLPGAFIAGMSLYSDPRVTASHPVEKISWWEARETLARVGLELPTEMQWEHSARAGRDFRYLVSGEPNVIRSLANSLDSRFAPLVGAADPGFDDGFALPAQLGSFDPNGYGLFDVLGNVAEWCRDAYSDSCEKAPPRAGDGEVVPVERFARSYRGGSYRSDAFDLRVSRRHQLGPDDRAEDLGVRPARRIDP